MMMSKFEFFGIIALGAVMSFLVIWFAVPFVLVNVQAVPWCGCITLACMFFVYCAWGLIKNLREGEL
jgi:hypothetical protein